jgi:hypothetical protein
VSSSDRFGAAVADARTVARIAQESSPRSAAAATKTHAPGAVVVDAVTGQIGLVTYASTQHVHTAPAAK